MGESSSLWTRELEVKRVSGRATDTLACPLPRPLRPWTLQQSYWDGLATLSVPFDEVAVMLVAFRLAVGGERKGGGAK